MLENNSFSLFGNCSTTTVLVPYPCNCKVFLKYFSFFCFLIIEPYFGFVIQNLLYCFNILVYKISTAIQGKEQQYHTTSHTGAYVVNKDPKSVKFLYRSVLAKLQSEHQQLKNLYTNHEELYNCNRSVLWFVFVKA